jgi:hypothetical protein
MTAPETRLMLARKAALFRVGTKRIYEGQGDRADMWFFELFHFLGDVESALALPSCPIEGRREEIARVLLDRRGFGFYLDPMEGGQDAYDLTLEALAEADAILALFAQPRPDRCPIEDAGGSQS